jgi:hypothetical protein
LGLKGVPGGWDVIDAGKKCGELGGKLYDGICLKSQKLDANADTIPFKCNPYQVPMPLLSFLLWYSSPTLCIWVLVRVGGGQRWHTAVSSSCHVLSYRCVMRDSVLERRWWIDVW